MSYSYHSEVSHENCRLQYLVFAAVSLTVFGFVVILHFTGMNLFERFTGLVSPLISFPLIIILGIVSFKFFISNNWFAILSIKFEVRQ